jgi:hypothetical protein
LKFDPKCPAKRLAFLLPVVTKKVKRLKVAFETKMVTKFLIVVFCLVGKGEFVPNFTFFIIAVMNVAELLR